MKSKFKKPKPQQPVYLLSDKCAECGYRLRGKNHSNGDHHKGTVPKLDGKK